MNHSTSTPEKGIPTNQDGVTIANTNAVFLCQLDKQIDLVREGVTYHLGTYGQAPRCDCLRTGELRECDDILNAYMADPACPDSIKPLIRKCANNTVHEEDHEDGLYYAGELQIAIENLLGESETFTQQEPSAVQVEQELVAKPPLSASDQEFLDLFMQLNPVQQAAIEQLLKIIADHDQKGAVVSKAINLDSWKPEAEKVGINRETISFLSIKHAAAVQFNTESAWREFYDAVCLWGEANESDMLEEMLEGDQEPCSVCDGRGWVPESEPVVTLMGRYPCKACNGTGVAQ